MTNVFEKFDREFTAKAKKLIPEQLIPFHKKIALDALKGIVDKTPVDTGRARGNWQVSIGNPIEEEIDFEDKIGQETNAKGESALAELGLFQVIYISNNVNYILFLEEGTEKTPPVGMVANTVEELRSEFT